MPRFKLLCPLLLLLLSPLAIAGEPFSEDQGPFNFDPVLYNFEWGNFTWTIGNPVLQPPDRPGDTVYSVKQPTVVHVGDRWHLFYVTRTEKHNHQVEYITFKDWPDAKTAEPHILNLGDLDFSSPQVFYFRPQKKWYLILQAPDKTHPAQMVPYFSTSNDIADPKLWTKPQPMIAQLPPENCLWKDFWVICDDEDAYLFGGSRDGRMWRSHTALEDFPDKGWAAPQDILKRDFMGAARIYKVRGPADDTYLAIIEAMDVGKRYYKAYTASGLFEGWSDLAPHGQPPPALRTAFAGPNNIFRKDSAEHWTDSISHGEILRAGFDEQMEIDPHDWKMVFQGMTNDDRAGRDYGQVTWRLGLLDYAKPPPLWSR